MIDEFWKIQTDKNEYKRWTIFCKEHSQPKTLQPEAPAKPSSSLIFNRLPSIRKIMASGYATGFLLLYGIFCNFLAQAAWVEDLVELYPTPTHRMQRLTNFTRCGGDGKVTEIREDSCENLGDKCRYKIDEFPRHQQMDFVPGKEHKQIGVRITLFPDGQESKVAIDRKLSKSSVKAGTEYTVAHSVFLDPSAKGLSGLSRHEIYDVDDLSTIVCAQGYFIVE